jgi:uncharacterized protein YcfJ
LLLSNRLPNPKWSFPGKDLSECSKMMQPSMDSAEWKIFVSYSHADIHIVRPLTELIRVTGVGAFRDEDSIPKGARWQMVISDSIAYCKTLIVFWSARAAISEAMASEYNLAIHLHKDVVPVLLDGTPLNEALLEYQWIDLREILSSHRKNGRRRCTKIGAAAGAAAGTVLGPLGAIGGSLIGFAVGSLVGAVAGAATGFVIDASTGLTMSDVEKRSFITALEARIIKSA